MRVWQVIVTGVLVHVVLFYSIFDIYFTSPLVHGMTPHISRNKPPAERLVLFVADGLRADKFFELDPHTQRPRAPYLRKVMEEDGAWGVSHTRVPTESRPGHVALIAGFYEDVSAVAKGWKENPVEFDSVFNQSRYTWSWGSPDILPMFAKGATGEHVHIHCYPAHLEDFAGSDMSQLDLWVFRQVKTFLASAHHNATLMRQLGEDKLVFFLHLLGIDTNGHSNKPHSQEYLNNIRVVDDGIKSVVDMVETFYDHDGKTAYVMTADHGMTNWGSHGAGDPHETLTPLVAWGAGVRGPVPTHGDCGSFDDGFCSDWRLQHRGRADVSQADVAPLMAFLVGVPFPVNSVGVLPVEYLSGTDVDRAEGLLANAQQILAQYHVKMMQVKDRTVSATFRPFRHLSSSAEADLLRNVRNLISSGHYQDAISECKFIIETALKGLRYYQTYDRFFLGVSITLGFLGWMGYVLTLLVSEHTASNSAHHPERHLQLDRRSPSTASYLLFGSVGVIVAFLLFAQSLPWTNYVYCLMPVLLWMKCVQGWDVVKRAVVQSAGQSSLLPVIISVVCTVLGLEIIVLSFFHRELLSLGLVAMAMWVLTTPLWNSNKGLCGGWVLSCMMVAVFPLLPVVGRNANYTLVLLSGLIAVMLGSYMVWRKQQGLVDSWSAAVLCVQLLVIAMATLMVKITSDAIASKSGVPVVSRVFSWLILCVSPCLPLLTGVLIELRLLSLCLAFLAPYLLMSITYEGLFALCLMAMLYYWLQLETELTRLDTPSKTITVLSFRRSPASLDKKLSPPTPRHLHMADLRRAFFFIFLILTAFFGTGNIASINSFDPASVYCFLTVFNPFIMGALMMLKVVLPFVVVTCVLSGIQAVTQVPLRALLLIVLLMSDFMGMNFFFLVRDEGSWLEIGTSISHYIIVMSMITFVTLLMGMSTVLTSTTLPLSAHRHRH